MAIWWHRSGSTLAQVMTCCLIAPSHYLNQCWLVIGEILWHSSEGKRYLSHHSLKLIWKLLYLKFQLKSPMGQWVKTSKLYVWIENNMTCYPHGDITWQPLIKRDNYLYFGSIFGHNGYINKLHFHCNLWLSCLWDFTDLEIQMELHK